MMSKVPKYTLQIENITQLTLCKGCGKAIVLYKAYLAQGEWFFDIFMGVFILPIEETFRKFGLEHDDFKRGI